MKDDGISKSDEYGQLKQLVGVLSLTIPILCILLTVLYYISIFPVLALKIIVGIVLLIPFFIKTYYSAREVISGWDGTNYRDLSLFLIGTIITLSLIIALAIFYIDVIGFFIFIMGG